MQKEFLELYKRYGFDTQNKSRLDLSETEERQFVKDCFDIYEHIGFAKIFNTQYTDKKKFIGMKFTVIDRVKNISEDNNNGADLESLPMWNIQFENGDKISAYPEEICLAER